MESAPAQGLDDFLHEHISSDTHKFQKLLDHSNSSKTLNVRQKPEIIAVGPSNRDKGVVRAEEYRARGRIVHRNTRFRLGQVDGDEGAAEHQDWGDTESSVADVDTTPVVNRYRLLSPAARSLLARGSGGSDDSTPFPSFPSSAGINALRSAYNSPKRGGGVLVFRLTWGPDASKSAYVAWSGNPQTQNRQVRDHSGVLHENLLEIDSTHGQLLGLTEGTVVGVEFVSDIGVCTAAEVEVGGVDDWEILELNAGAVEDGLLRQARVVAVGQPLVFWLNASTHVRLVPRGMVPQAAVALLDNDSEVAVAPMVRRQQQPAPSAEEGRNTAAVSCLRVAGSGADDVLPSVVFVHPSSAVAQLCSARIGHGCMRAGASAADDAMWLAPWLAAVAIDARVQPGVLLAQTATLAHMGFAVGEVVRVGAVVKSMVDPPLALHFECFGEAVLGCEDVREALLPGGAGSQAVFGVGFCVAAGARLRSFCAAGEAVEPSECRETPLRVTRETLAQVVITVGGWPKGQKDGLNQP
ncbi:Peroxisome biosynthesis protein pex1, partial [Kickxella alabastrina]